MTVCNHFWDNRLFADKLEIPRMGKRIIEERLEWFALTFSWTSMHDSSISWGTMCVIVNGRHLDSKMYR